MAQNAPGRPERDGITLVQFIDKFPDDATAERWFIESRWKDGIPLPLLRQRQCQRPGCSHHHAFPLQQLQEAFLRQVEVHHAQLQAGLPDRAIAIYLVATNIQGHLQHEAPQGPRHHTEDGLAPATPNPAGLRREQPPVRWRGRG